MKIKVVCIDNFNTALKRYKVYDVLKYDFDYSYDRTYRIMGSNYSIDRFITLAEWRDKQINNILNED